MPEAQKSGDSVFIAGTVLLVLIGVGAYLTIQAKTWYGLAVGVVIVALLVKVFRDLPTR